MFDDMNGLQTRIIKDTKCEICGCTYDATFLSNRSIFGDIYSGDRVSLTRHIDNKIKTRHFFEICPNCSRKIDEYIELLKLERLKHIILNPKETPHNMAVDLDKVDVTDEIEMLKHYVTETSDFDTCKLFEMFEEEDDGNI